MWPHLCLLASLSLGGSRHPFLSRYFSLVAEGGRPSLLPAVMLIKLMENSHDENWCTTAAHRIGVAIWLGTYSVLMMGFELREEVDPCCEKEPIVVCYQVRWANAWISHGSRCETSCM